jgi:hypothetical protein
VEEKRQFVRVPCTAKAQILDADFSSEADLVDVSIGGALMRTGALLPEDTRVQVQFQFQDMPGDNVISAKATVVRTPGKYVGVRFDGVDDISAGRLLHWMSRNHPEPQKFEQEMVRVRGRGWASA